MQDSNDYSYLQNQFRKQAQKRITQTKDMFGKNKNMHEQLLRKVYYQTVKYMRQAKIYDERGRATGLISKEQADELFLVYHQAYLNLARSKTESNNPLKPKHIEKYI